MTGAAAARLYDDHVVAVHAMIARRVGETAATEVTAETFELALRTWDQFDVDRGTERLFLLGAAATTLRDHADAEHTHLRNLRRPTGRSTRPIDDPLVSSTLAQRRGRVVDHAANDDLWRSDPAVDAHDDGAGDDTPITTAAFVAEPDGPADSGVPIESDMQIMEAVAALDPDDRDILLLSLWESCSQSDIAEALSTSVSNVRSSLGRIRRELKIAVAKT